MSPSAMAKLQEDIEMTERQKYLKMHPYTIGQTSDGRWYTRIQDSNTGKTKTLIKKNRIDLETYLVNIYKTPEVNPTLYDLFTQANNKKLEREQIQKNTYCRYIEMYHRYIGSFGEKHIQELTMDDFVQFIEDAFYKKHLDKKAYEKLRSILNMILKEAYKNRLIDYTLEQITICLDISKKDISRHKKPDTPQVYTQEEQQKIKQFCETSDDIRDKGILLELSCGFRQGELVALTWENYKRDYITVNALERKERDENGKYHFFVEANAGKTANSIRMIPLSPLAKRTLESLRERAESIQGYIFVYPNGNRIQAQVIYKRLKRVCKKLGIEYKSPHKLRKTFVSECINSNMPLQTVQRVVGHSEPGTTLRFYTFNTLKDEKISQYYESSAMLK